MTSISTLLNSSSYSLSSKQASEIEAATSATPTTTEKVTEKSSSGAYNLDLSKEAQAYLAALDKKNKTEEKDYGFTISAADQKIIDDIVAKYEDMPYTQENFEKLQADLKKAGVDPQRLAAKDMVKNFNPTELLMAALSGKTDLPSANDRLKEQAKNGDVFADQVAEDWYNQIHAKDDA